jgi:hypothetical protein
MLKITNWGKDIRKKEINIRRNEVEEDFYVMGMKKRHVKARDRRKWRKTVFETKVQNGL